jgi:hypothetical protein
MARPLLGPQLLLLLLGFGFLGLCSGAPTKAQRVIQWAKNSGATVSNENFSLQLQGRRRFGVIIL